MNKHTENRNIWHNMAPQCLIALMLVFAVQVVDAQPEFTKFVNGQYVAEDGRISQDPPPSLATQDSLALVSFYHSTGGDNWFDNSGWLVDPAATWVGVHTVSLIEDEWRVTRMSLRTNGLTGTIPEDFSDLSRLQRFEFDRNMMSGPFPMALTEMPVLNFVDIGFQFFTGEFPWAQMGALPNLNQWKMGSNYFEGQVPDFTEGSWPSLAVFQIQNNLLSGPLPGGIEHITNLRWFRGQYNRFTGSIDVLEPVKNITSFTELRLDGNYGLEPGPIPNWISEGVMPNTLQTLYLDGTNRTGEIPEWFNNMWELVTFQLGGGDEIGGEIPYMGDALSLTQLYINKANFVGPIPDWVGGQIIRLRVIDTPGINGQLPVFTNLERAHLENVSLEGPFPNWGGLPINELTLNNIGFEITDIPSWIGELTSLTVLKLVDLGITGDLPGFLANLPDLNEVSFGDNPGITGDVPSWLINLQDLETLELSRTSLNITEIPAWLQNHEDLAQIELAGLGMTGTIPEWIGDLQWLNRLVLNDNQLTGELPSQLGNLAFMDSLNVANNQLTGEIPASLSDMGIFDNVTNLTSLVLSGNMELSGEIPLSFINWNPDVLRVLHFDDTNLCEPTDQTLINWLDEVATPWDPNNHILLVSVKTSGISCVVNIADIGQRYRFHLYGNYPNPFNPSTTIKYEVPSEQHVTLSIYNIVGQKVATLVDELKTAGQYNVTFNAEYMASGTYIYRLKAGESIQTRKMILIK